MSCNCHMAKMNPGTIVVISGSEHDGLFIYVGDSGHSTSYRHTVKLLRYNDTDAAWHVHCKTVYAPDNGNLFWPYNELVTPEEVMAVVG